MKFATDSPFANLDFAVQKLMEICNGVDADHAQRLQVAVINQRFLDAGGKPAEYGAAVKAAIERGYLTQHRSGAYLMFTQVGADLFA